MDKKRSTETEYREVTVLVALADTLDGVLYRSLPFKKAYELRGELFETMRLQLARLSENGNTVIQ